MKKQIVKLVDIETVEIQLADPHVTQETVDELYQFGSIVLADVRQRASWVESKLTITLGWSTGGLALLLAGSSMAVPLRGTIALVFLLSALIAAFALKTRMTAAISEKDWFKEALWVAPTRMKRYHVVSMLLCHQQYATSLDLKGECLKYAEALLVAGAVLMAAVLFWSRF